VPRMIGIFLGVGFVLSLAFLVAVSLYAIALREALFQCRQAQVSISNQHIQCENKIGALKSETATLAAQIESERSNARALEARLEAAGALRRCASGTYSPWHVGQS
jgi:hypothetical protein